MKRILATAAFAALAAPAFAADAIPQPDYVAEPAMEAPANACSGHVEAYVGGITLEASGQSESGTAYGGAGRVNCHVTPHWNLQGDLLTDGLTVNGDNLYTYGAAGHAYWRDPNAFALGGFATIDGFGGSAIGTSDIYRWTVGPEAQFYMNNVTLYGQAYYGQLRATSSSTSLDIWGARGVVRYFARENLRFDGELGYRELNIAGTNLDTFTAAAQATYRFDGTPWSVYGRYQYDQLSAGGGGNLNLHKYVLGVRASFGSKSLFDEDRNGATMDTSRTNYVLY